MVSFRMYSVLQRPTNKSIFDCWRRDKTWSVPHHWRSCFPCWSHELTRSHNKPFSLPQWKVSGVKVCVCEMAHPIWYNDRLTYSTGRLVFSVRTLSLAMCLGLALIQCCVSVCLLGLLFHSSFLQSFPRTHAHIHLTNVNQEIQKREPRTIQACVVTRSGCELWHSSYLAGVQSQAFNEWCIISYGWPL